ncbi:phosphatase 1 regulatory subunit 12A-like [Paramuricea clavata]|uniref:Phosphatase 1 regulatory subunit 12A-like n=1 Tax=Paramuricea clavata TaxID=317549 RepID=A0A7D9EEU3_PARCT|nr:phosphatase 1 regulatory subunit 12A-like [Paramuricea clavata]
MAVNKKRDDHDLLGRTYLMHAIHGECQEETVEYILSLHFNINHQAHDGSTALHVVCQHQKTHITALLLKNKASVSIKDKKGRSALHWAAKSQSNETVKMLLQYGADINVQDCDGMTPAMWACYFNKPDNLHILRNALERVDPRSDAILDKQDNMGRTVLHWAAMTCDQNCSLSCLKELLELSDICKVKDDEGRTVLHTAAIQGSVSACKQILLSCDEDILNMQDSQDQTALHLATLSGHGELVDFLLQHGANSSVCNKNERTALQEAESGHYHYCLLVFAAFEQMKDKKETKAPLDRSENDVEKKNKDRKRYESWVIPSTSLNESHNLPTEVMVDQLVDVTDIKGFEINDELDDQIIENVSLPEKLVLTKDKPATQNPATTRDKPHKPAMTSNKPVMTNTKHVIKPDKPVTTTDGRNHVTSRSNKSAFLQRSEKVDETREMKQEESDVHKDGNTNESPADEDVAAYPSEQHDSQSESENIEISSLNMDSDDDDSEEVPDDEEINKTSCPEPNQTSRQTPNSESKRPTKGNLAPIKPLSQPSLNLSAKLDPIPLLHSNKKAPQSRGIVTPHNVQSRGIVAPLQPPVQKEQPGLSLLSRDKLQHLSAGTQYGSRGPDHGPLAQAHSKQLLNNVFKVHTV